MFGPNGNLFTEYWAVFQQDMALRRSEEMIFARTSQGSQISQNFRGGSPKTIHVFTEGQRACSRRAA